MVRIYMFIVCLVLLLGMSTCVPVWAAQPSASYGYDAATHCGHSLDSDCQSTPPGCSYVALEHKTDCIHSESRTNNTGLFGILCWSSIIVVGYLSVSRAYDASSNKFDNSPHRPNYDVRIEPRCTSTTTLKNEMSQYRAYFVPGGMDPLGLDRHIFAIEGNAGFPQVTPDSAGKLDPPDDALWNPNNWVRGIWGSNSQVLNFWKKPALAAGKDVKWHYPLLQRCACRGLVDPSLRARSMLDIGSYRF